MPSATQAKKSKYKQFMLSEVHAKGQHKEKA